MDVFLVIMNTRVMHAFYHVEAMAELRLHGMPCSNHLTFVYYISSLIEYYYALCPQKILLVNEMTSWIVQLCVHTAGRLTDFSTGFRKILFFL